MYLAASFYPSLHACCRRTPWSSPLALMPEINTNTPHNFIQASRRRADGGLGEAGHPVGGWTVCKGCKASMHRFQNTALKGVHEARCWPGKVCIKCRAVHIKFRKKFFRLHEKCARSAIFP